MRRDADHRVGFHVHRQAGCIPGSSLERKILVLAPAGVVGHTVLGLRGVAAVEEPGEEAVAGAAVSVPHCCVWWLVISVFAEVHTDESDVLEGKSGLLAVCLSIVSGYS